MHFYSQFIIQVFPTTYSFMSLTLISLSFPSMHIFYFVKVLSFRFLTCLNCPLRGAHSFCTTLPVICFEPVNLKLSSIDLATILFEIFQTLVQRQQFVVSTLVSRIIVQQTLLSFENFPTCTSLFQPALLLDFEICKQKP